MKLLFLAFCSIYFFIVTAKEQTFEEKLNKRLQNEKSSEKRPALLDNVVLHNKKAHLRTVKGLLEMRYDKQSKMISLLGEKVFKELEDSKAVLEAAGFVPSVKNFKFEEDTFKALSSVMEMTTFFGRVLYYIPEVTAFLVRQNRDWEALLAWSVDFLLKTAYLDMETRKLMYLVAQEMNFEERDPLYVNPNWKSAQVTEKNSDKKQKKKKTHKKGPSIEL